MNTVAAFLAIFMMSGFEYAAVPAGEVRDAKRTVPLAVVGSIAGASLLYALLQTLVPFRQLVAKPDFLIAQMFFFKTGADAGSQKNWVERLG